MIGRIVTGKSFSGVGKYVLHDKGRAQTSERVEWTYTHNVLSNDAEKAFKEMAWTAKNSRFIKSEIGGSMAGRKSNGKDVLHSMLSWHPEQKPTREQMRAAGLDYLKAQGLEDHEAVFVAHNDEKHAHMHIVSNLINPLNGKKHTQSMSQRKMQAWAHEYEKRSGKIYCKERAANQERLKTKEKNVRYRDPQNPHKKNIREMYERSNTGAEFAARASAAGYQFGKGKRDFILMDDQGKRYNVARFAPDKTKGVRAKFADLTELPDIEAIRERQAQGQTRDKDTANEQGREQAAHEEYQSPREDPRAQKMEEAREKLRDQQEKTPPDERERSKEAEPTRERLESERQQEFKREATPEQDNRPLTREERKAKELKQFDKLQEEQHKQNRDRSHDHDRRQLAPDIGY